MTDISPKTLATIEDTTKRAGLGISSLAYYDNNLDADENKRAFINRHLLRCIDYAALLGVPSVGTFVWRDYTKSVEKNFDLFEKVFVPIVEYAAERNVQVVIENCPMDSWQISGMPGTISFSPELWDEMFRRVPHANFGLNYDPSHMYLMKMDYLSPIRQFGDRIFHVHAKDGLIDDKKFAYYGVYNRQLGRELTNGFWTCKIPGHGGVDFVEFFEQLASVGYNGTVSIELEDPQFEGSPEAAKKGLLLSKEYLQPFIR